MSYQSPGVYIEEVPSGPQPIAAGQLHRYIDLDGRHEVAGERVACAGLSERTGQTIGYP